MRSDAARVARAVVAPLCSYRPAGSGAVRTAVAVGLLVLATACSGGGAARPTAPPHRAATAATAVPAPVAIRGTLNARTAGTVYEAAIAPAYPLAVKLAGTLALHPASASAAVSNFASRLAKALASFGAVTAFPAQAESSFAAYRSMASHMLIMLDRPAAVAASEQSRRQAALQLYALARQIGVLGADLNLVPATEAGGKH